MISATLLLARESLRKIAKAFADHRTVNHSRDEYVRGDASTNTIEGFFSTFKRGMNGVYRGWQLSSHAVSYAAARSFRVRRIRYRNNCCLA